MCDSTMINEIDILIENVYTLCDELLSVNKVINESVLDIIENAIKVIIDTIKRIYVFIKNKVGSVVKITKSKWDNIKERYKQLKIIISKCNEDDENFVEHVVKIHEKYEKLLKYIGEQDKKFADLSSKFHSISIRDDATIQEARSALRKMESQQKALEKTIESLENATGLTKGSTYAVQEISLCEPVMNRAVMRNYISHLSTLYIYANNPSKVDNEKLDKINDDLTKWEAEQVYQPKGFKVDENTLKTFESIKNSFDKLYKTKINNKTDIKLTGVIARAARVATKIAGEYNMLCRNIATIE